MAFTKLPCIYFPTKILMVDDNLAFLENIRLAIDDYQNVDIYTNPVELIRKLSDYNAILSSINLISNIDVDETDEDNVLSINYKKLQDIIYYDREISVIVVDYSMPEMNGIEFFNKIKSFPAKKIMLTGEADNQIAVNAFNEGLIDRFIVKGGENVAETLNLYVRDLMVQYFIDCKVNNLISIENNIKESRDYKNIATDWIKEKNICRFYQIDQNGSLIGEDRNNNQYCFYITNTDSFNSYEEIAKYQGADENIIEQLTLKKGVPVFMTADSLKYTANEWLNLMKIINGYFEYHCESYYYSFFDL